MNGTHILDLFRSQLAKQILEQDTTPPSFNPLDISPWLAMSLLQKAIRRGRTNLALRAVATLLTDNPDRLWRRLGVTVFEDIGVADYETVSLVMAGLSGKRFRAKLGGEWAVASHLVNLMCVAVKCRAADDLAVACDWHAYVDELKELGRDEEWLAALKEVRPNEYKAELTRRSEKHETEQLKENADAGDEVRDSLVVTSSEYPHLWNLTVTEGRLRCEDGPLYNGVPRPYVLFEAGGKTYGVNGAAMGKGGYKDARTLLKGEAGQPPYDLKMLDILLKAGLERC